jgi:hypothetical protein
MVNGFRDARERMNGSAEARKESWECNEDEMMRSCRTQSGKPRQLLVSVSTGRHGKAIMP